MEHFVEKQAFWILLIFSTGYFFEMEENVLVLSLHIRLLCIFGFEVCQSAHEMDFKKLANLIQFSFIFSAPFFQHFKPTTPGCLIGQTR